MKRIISAILVIIFLMLLSGCGGTTFKIAGVDDNFDRAIIKLPDGNVIDVKVKQWTSGAYSDEIAIVDENGTIYRTNSVNCVLIKEGEKINDRQRQIP